MTTREDQSDSISEFTLKAVVAGVGFGILFGAANAYLGLKAGLTVSTSIPIAVLSTAVFRLMSRRGGTILEANMAQTIGSASSSLASGTIFTVPALFMWGVVPPIHQVAILAWCGGVLGILAMIPLRRLLIVQADKELPYPEGRACADVLRAAGDSASSRWIFIGLATGAAVKVLGSFFKLLPESASCPLGALPNATLAIAIAPALLAVGYIVGFRASSIMVGGSLLTAIVLAPLITRMHGEGVAAAKATLAPLTAGDVRSRYIIFIGAGAVAAAGIITVIKTVPTMASSLLAVVRGLKSQASGVTDSERTDRDLPSGVIIAGLLILVLVLGFVPGVFAGNLTFGGRLAAAASVAVFGFLFVPVSSRLVGLIGVSSNPTSAMALITLTTCAAIFALMGWSGIDAKAAVLTVGTVVCVAASKAGDISQDLKTGWLVGGTPARQQFGQLIAAACACWAVAAVVCALGEKPGFTGPGAMAAPQAKLMKTVVEAVLGETLDWGLLLTGISLGGIGFLVGLPPLQLALGIYLPLGTMAAIFVGGCARKYSESRPGVTESHVQKGVLCASGLVAGEGLAGVAYAINAFVRNLDREQAPPPSTTQQWAGVAIVLCVAILLAWSARRTAPAPR